MADKKNWLQLLAYVTGSINQELLWAIQIRWRGEGGQNSSASAEKTRPAGAPRESAGFQVKSVLS